MEPRRDTPDDRTRSAGRHDLVIVLVAAAVLAIGVGTGAFAAIHDRLRSTASGLAESASGIMLVTCVSGGAIAVRQRARGEAESRRRSETEAKYQAMIEQVPAVAYTWDPADEPGSAPAAYISPQIERLLGFTADQWIVDPTLWARQVHPDDLDGVLDAWREAVARHGRFVAEYRIATATGATVWLRDEAAAVTIDGRRRYRGVMQDVTHEREVQQSLAAAEARYRSLVEQLPAVIYVDAVDELVTARYVSPRYEELTGYTQAERMADPGLWMRIITRRPRSRRRGVQPHERDRRGLRRRAPDRAQRRACRVGPRSRRHRGGRRWRHRLAGGPHRHHRPQGRRGGPREQGSDPRGRRLRGGALPARVGPASLHRRGARATRERGGGDEGGGVRERRADDGPAVVLRHAWRAPDAGPELDVAPSVPYAYGEASRDGSRCSRRVGWSTGR